MTETVPTPSTNGSGGSSSSSGTKKPRNSARPPAGAFREMGQTERTGRRIDGRTYDRYEPKLSGAQAFLTYEEMITDATLGGVMLAIEQIVRSVSWRVEPAGGQAKYLKAAQFLEECRNDMSDTWADFIVETLSMLPHGWSFHEIVYKYRRGFNENPMYHSKYDDGLVSWRKFPIRSQDSLVRWEWQDDGDGILGMTQNVDPKNHNGFGVGAEVTIPLYPKGLLFRTKLNRRSPEGKSILRNAYRSWYMKRRIEEIEGIGMERELAGLPILIAPEGIDLWDDSDDDMKEVRREAQELIKLIRANEAEGLLLPFGWEFKLASTGGTRAIDVGKVIERYTRHATMSMLADFIVLGHESVGSFSLADVKTNLFAFGLGAWLDVITEVINQYAVPRLFRLNQRFPQDKLPQIKHGDTEAPDLNELGGFITSLTGANVIIPGPEIEEYVRSAGGLPPVPEERKQMHQDIMQMTLEQKLAPPVDPNADPNADPAAQNGAKPKTNEDPTQPVSGRDGKPATSRQQAAQTQNGRVGTAVGASQQKKPATKPNSPNGSGA